MSDCPRFGKLFGGCSFSPRFDTGAPTATDLKGDAVAVYAVIEHSKPRTYVRDVCERCGRTVER
jgi:hypothetical protein